MVTPLSIASLLRVLATRLPASLATVVAVAFVCAELLLTIFLDSFGALGAAALALLTGAFTTGRFATDLPATGLRDDAFTGLLTAVFLTVLADAALLVALFLPTALFGTAFFVAAFFIEALFATVFFAAEALLVDGLAAGLTDLADFLAIGFDAPVVARARAATFLTTGPFAAPTRLLDFALPGFALPGFVLLAAMVKLVLFGSAGACYSLSVWQRQPLKSLD